MPRHFHNFINLILLSYTIIYRKPPMLNSFFPLNQTFPHTICSIHNTHRSLILDLDFPQKKMAKLIFGAIFLTLFSLVFIGGEAGKSPSFLETKAVEGGFKVSKLHFYVQDIAGGSDPTVYEVARASITENSSSRFGQVKVMDHKVTVGPEQDSAEIGRVQGVIAGADLAVMAFATNLNFHFTVGEYNGSTVSIAGRNQIGLASREMPVIGGTGLFRFATGYSVSSTYSYEAATSHSVIEYTLYVKSGLQNTAREFQ